MGQSSMFSSVADALDLLEEHDAVASAHAAAAVAAPAAEDAAAAAVAAPLVPATRWRNSQ